jgi:hypothetical protein
MSLHKWAEYGWLRREETSPDEIQRLLKVVDRDLADSAVDKISDDLRFIAALGAALVCATIPLRASGYRTTTGRGQHEKTIESLEFTVEASSKIIQALKTLSRKRNAANYDMADAISEQDLKRVTAIAAELRSTVVGWLEKKYPLLLK